MDIFTELVKYPIFTIVDVKKYTGNEKTEILCVSINIYMLTPRSL